MSKINSPGDECYGNTKMYNKNKLGVGRRDADSGWVAMEWWGAPWAEKRGEECSPAVSDVIAPSYHPSLFPPEFKINKSSLK